jgi:hypothetical protein
MTQIPVGFTLDTLTRKKIEKFRRQQKDARLHNRLSALLRLSQGRSTDEVAQLLGLCPRTIANWRQLYQRGGLDKLLTLGQTPDPSTPGSRAPAVHRRWLVEGTTCKPPQSPEGNRSSSICRRRRQPGPSSHGQREQHVEPPGQYHRRRSPP